MRLDEIRYGGLWSRWRAQHPNVPEYVLKQMYVNHVSPRMRDELRQKSRGTVSGYAETIALPSGDAKFGGILDGVVWSKKPVIVSVSPLDFDEWTLQTLLAWRFGFSKLGHVRDDANRTDAQRRLAAERGDGNNEPVVLLDVDGPGAHRRYRLVEGFHRTASYLLQGAPEEQIEFIKIGRADKVDFRLWRDVRIKAFVGRRGGL